MKRLGGENVQPKASRPGVSKTKQLARELGLLPTKRKPRENPDGHVKRRRKGQMLTYVMVIDFESTCWKDKKTRPEIIEFPAVLMDLSNGKTVSEFHHYLLPTEYPILSSFCKELTGISQTQVNNGIPLPTCLYLFNQWVRKLQDELGMVLMEPGRQYTDEDSLCALVTWSDWDLEVCLGNECSRKQIRKPPCLSQWIDIRAVYRTFYERKPCGLNGALEDLGIMFVGRQHSGIDDAKNTANLCYRMVQDGCRLTITKCIHRQIRSQIRAPNLGRQRNMISNTKPAAQVSSCSTEPAAQVISSTKPAAQVNLNQVSKEPSPFEGTCVSGAVCPGFVTACRPGTVAVVAVEESGKKNGAGSPEDVQGGVPSGPHSCVARVDTVKADCCHMKATPCSPPRLVAQVLPSRVSSTCDSETMPKTKSPVQDEWADLSSGELFCELAQEMDIWEREFEKGTEGVVGTVRNSKPKPAVTGGVGCVSETPSWTPGPVSASCGSPSRPPVVSTHAETPGLWPGVVAHVAPVTLLPAVASTRWGLSDDPARGFHGTDKGSRKAASEKVPRLPGDGATSAFLRCNSKGCNLGPLRAVDVNDMCEVKSSSMHRLKKERSLRSPGLQNAPLVPCHDSKGWNLDPMTTVDGRVSPRGGCNSRTEDKNMHRLANAPPCALVRHSSSCWPAGDDPDDSPVLFLRGGMQWKGEDIERHPSYTPVRPGAASSVRHSPATIEETPPHEQGINAVPLHGVVPVSEGHGSSSDSQRADSAHSNVSSEGGSFKTPNISRWLNSKRCADFSTPSPSSFTASGGKVTPPLCGCGRRAKRKFVTSPGPNEGLPFYVCPVSRGNDRKLGCNYFKWEKCDSDSVEPLLSDYGECR